MQPTMKLVVMFALCVGCTQGPTPIDHVYEVTARSMDSGPCTGAGEPTVFAVPYRALVADDDYPDLQAWTWCSSRTDCDPVSSNEWFDADGDRWTRIGAEVRNGPDNTVYCDLAYDTLEVRETADGAHVDVLLRSTFGSLDNCTKAQAVELLANEQDCRVIDRYDLAP